MNNKNSKLIVDGNQKIKRYTLKQVKRELGEYCGINWNNPNIWEYLIEGGYHPTDAEAAKWIKHIETNGLPRINK